MLLKAFDLPLRQISFIGGRCIKLSIFIVPCSSLISRYLEGERVGSVLECTVHFIVFVAFSVIVNVSGSQVEMSVSEFLHGGLRKRRFDDLLFIVVKLVDCLHWLSIFASKLELHQIITFAIQRGLWRFCSKRTKVSGDHRQSIVAQYNCIFSVVGASRATQVSLLAFVLIIVGRLIVGVFLFHEVVVVTSHFVLTFFLIFGSIA